MIISNMECISWQLLVITETINALFVVVCCIYFDVRKII